MNAGWNALNKLDCCCGCGMAVCVGLPICVQVPPEECPGQVDRTNVKGYAEATEAVENSAAWFVVLELQTAAAIVNLDDVDAGCPARGNAFAKCLIPRRPALDPCPAVGEDDPVELREWRGELTGYLPFGCGIGAGFNYASPDANPAYFGVTGATTCGGGDGLGDPPSNWPVGILLAYEGRHGSAGHEFDRYVRQSAYEDDGMTATVELWVKNQLDSRCDATGAYALPKRIEVRNGAKFLRVQYTAPRRNVFDAGWEVGVASARTNCCRNRMGADGGAWWGELSLAWVHMPRLIPAAELCDVHPFVSSDCGGVDCQGPTSASLSLSAATIVDGYALLADFRGSDGACGLLAGYGPCFVIAGSDSLPRAFWSSGLDDELDRDPTATFTGSQTTPAPALCDVMVTGL